MAKWKKASPTQYHHAFTPLGQVLSTARDSMSPLEALPHDQREVTRTGHLFLAHPLGMARLDTLACHAAVPPTRQSPDCRWDLVVCGYVPEAGGCPVIPQMSCSMAAASCSVC